MLLTQAGRTEVAAARALTLRGMTADETSPSVPHVRLRVELVVEVADPEALTRAALNRIDGDELMPDEERGHARNIVERDAGEAIAYLVDPVDLVAELPGVELAQASWGSEAAGGDLDDWDDSAEEEAGESPGEDDLDDVYEGPVGERAW